MNQDFKINEAFVGQRLDKFISNRLELSRNQTWRLLEQNYISLNNKKINKSFKGYSLQEGDVLTVAEFRTAQNLQIMPNNRLELNIIKDSSEYIVINKAAGINIIPKSESENNTILNALVAKYPQIQGIGEAGLHSGVVHRLDKDTSGVLIVAKTEDKWQTLRQAFKKHRSKKIYHAIILGNITKSGKAKMNLLVGKTKPAKVKVVSKPEAKTWLCDLSWHKLESFKNTSLIEISLGTGFLHQIRVMMAELGHPVLADMLYGSSSELVNRQMLHAKSIEIEDIKLSASYPADFKAVIESLKT